MSQVSLPMRIALVATLAFLALWMVALRPKPPAAAPPAPTPTPAAAAESAPGQAAAQAQQAAGASQESAAQQEQAVDAAGSGATPAGTARPAQGVDQAAAKPNAIDVQKAADPKTAKAAQAVLKDIAGGKVAVLLFWDPRLSDDRAVHTTVKGLDRRKGKVAVHVASIRDLADFEPITRGVPVVTSPTVLVIDRLGRARSVAGLTVPRELEELVGKALRVKQ